MVAAAHNIYPPSIRGFTLVETMIVVTILGLLLSSVVSNFGNFNKNQKVRQAGLTLKSELRAIQTKASSARVPSGCTGFSGYQVSFSGNTVTSSALCTSGNVVSTTKIGTSDLSITGSNVTFFPLSGGASAGTTVTVTSATNPTSYYAVNVTTSGSVNDLGLVTPTATPTPTPLLLPGWSCETGSCQSTPGGLYKTATECNDALMKGECVI